MRPIADLQQFVALLLPCYVGLTAFVLTAPALEPLLGIKRSAGRQSIFRPASFDPFHTKLQVQRTSLLVYTIRTSALAPSLH
jgi:hypothetical protein